MSNILEYAEELKSLAVKVKDFKNEIDKIGRGSFKFVLDEVVDSYVSMYERFCPYDIGDRVQLKEDVNIDSAPGWAGSRHFLVKGAKATVVEQGYANGHFTFHLEFDEESWLDNEEEIHLTNDKHTYHFSEIRLEPAEGKSKLKSLMGGCR